MVSPNFRGVCRYLTRLDLQVRPGSRSTELLVILHGWMGWPSQMNDVRDIVFGGDGAPGLADADVLMPHYRNWAGSNLAPELVAWDLVRLIDAAFEASTARGQSYERITLVGHSCGAMLVRKAIVYANGFTEDLPLAERPTAHSWAPRIRRAVLMAAVNRGWQTEERPRDAPWLFWVLLKVFAGLLRMFGLGGFIHGFRRGAPFIANLRIQWIRLSNAEPSRLPSTVQLLGDVDWLARREDNVDLESSKGFAFRTLSGAGHVNCVQLSPRRHPAHRAWFDSVCKSIYASDEQLATDWGRQTSTVDPEMDFFVFIMHGIRDYGDWTGQVAKEVRQIAAQEGLRVESCTSSYGRFPMGPFLLFSERQRNVRWFMDEYTENLARYPTARFCFVGHSNGTYLLGSALRRYASCRFDRVVLAGSVLPRTLQWKVFFEQGRVGAVQNYVATADWVVAWFPAFFEFVAGLLGRQADLGSAGHNGFLDDVARRHMVWSVRGGHGAAIAVEGDSAATARAHHNLALFALGKDVEPSAAPNFDPASAARSGLVEALHRYCPVLWMGLVTAVAAALVLPALLLQGPSLWACLSLFAALLLLTLWRA